MNSLNLAKSTSGLLQLVVVIGCLVEEVGTLQSQIIASASP